ncbi:hypothetical protein L9F63_028132, partial [Diploptera punctata]
MNLRQFSTSYEKKHYTFKAFLLQPFRIHDLTNFTFLDFRSLSPSSVASGRPVLYYQAWAATADLSTSPFFTFLRMMLALPGPRVMDRLSHEMAARRDRQIRLHSVQTDLELDLPPNIALPDGEEVPYGSSTRLQIRDNEQESEIYQKCIRPPPNRTVFDGESPPPYRSSSAGVLGSGEPGDWSSGGSSTTRVVRCHSVSSGSSSGSSIPAPAGPSDHRVATTGRPLRLGLSDYVARQFQWKDLNIHSVLQNVSSIPTLFCPPLANVGRAVPEIGG